ncbi:MAG TPA: SMP-30/gluconolactonase/LRE family protein [Allosphingosinicella sp.]|nr:SMP-30/gluconolactonase/LRE family protein [Allosphingosinicella sp.]
MDVALVAEGLGFPEGPVACADGSVIVAEIAGARITRVHPDGAKEVLAETGGGPNGLAIGPDGALWICNNGGSFSYFEQDGLNIPGPTPLGHEGGSIQRLDLDTGRLETVYESCDGHPLIGPNDIVFDKEGGFWFTDHGCTTEGGRRFGALLYATADGASIGRRREDLFSPNGVGISPDGGTVYVADTWLQRLWAFDLEAPGRLGPAPFPAPGRVVANLPGYQLLDSLAVEADGRVCVATIVNGGITAIEPAGGFEHHSVPDPICTNICFGGEDMRDAWITASGTGRLYKARWPRPGLKLAFNV